MLSILIPTYNRITFLVKNLDVLSKIITDAGLADRIRIIISDNCSTDGTQTAIGEYISSSELVIVYYKQEQNIGLKANALFVLSKSEDEYVMYLGDDDYISKEYLIECISIINNDKFAWVIVPNFIPISVSGEVLGPARDKQEPTRLYKPLFRTILKNSYKGHQLSGLILKRDGLLDIYFSRGVDNIYLFIFFIGIWSLKGNVYHLSNLPVRVTQPLQQKDWGYGVDGLVNEIFDNYKRLPINYLQRFVLEIYFMHKNRFRLFMYKSLGIRAFFKAFYKISFAANATILFSIVYPCYVSVNWAIDRIFLFTKRKKTGYKI